MTVTLTHHEFAHTRHGGDDLTRLERQDLVGISVEHE